MAELAPKSYRATSPETGPRNNAIAIIPSDADYIGNETHGVVIEKLYIGTAGNVTVETVGGQLVTYVNVQGYLDGIRIVRVMASGTTATDIIGEY